MLQPTLQPSATATIYVRRLMFYLRPENHWTVQEHSIVLSNGKVVHHDASRDGDGQIAYNLATGICYLVRHMRLALDIVSVEK